MAQKFIVVKDKSSNEILFQFGDVEFHKDLLKANQKCLGGGFYEIEDSNLFLYGESHDFGSASKKDISSSLVDFDFSVMEMILDSTIERVTIQSDGIIPKFRVN